MTENTIDLAVIALNVSSSSDATGPDSIGVCRHDPPFTKALDDAMHNIDLPGAVVCNVTGQGLPVERQKLPLDDSNRAVFTAINVLPNFKFSSDWQRPVRPNYEKVSVPVLLSFSKIGRVKKVVADPNFELPDALISRAKRAVRRATFRPRVDDGQPVEVVSEPYRSGLILRSATVDRILDRESTPSAAQEETNGQ